MPVKRLLTIGLVSLSLVVSSCALIEGEEATTTTIDEWTLDAYTDLVAFCQRTMSRRNCPQLITSARDYLNCTVEGMYLFLGALTALDQRGQPLDEANLTEAEERCR